MNVSDEENLLLATSWESVDTANRTFYARYPYPWPPKTFGKVADPAFHAVMLNQAVGDFSHETVPANGQIWVAGCGTNQAVYTAVAFPQAKVIGSDLSPASLAMCERTAASLGVTNLTLRQESLNEVAYRDAFDYIVSTGVIHHNADPARVLANIAKALRPDGILELMIYNRFHRVVLSAFQKAVRTIARWDGATATYDDELEIARALAATEKVADREYLARLRDAPEADLADTLIQPVEYSYTVQSLDAMAGTCDLALLLPCDNQFDQVTNRMWTVRFKTPELQQRIERLPDVARWQVTNLLFADRSPMLWFYLRHRRATDDARYERTVNEAFLDRRFTRASTQLQNFVAQAGGPPHAPRYVPAAPIPYPAMRARGQVREVIERADGTRPMRQIFKELGLDSTSMLDVTHIRSQTTAPLAPYLVARH